MARMVLPLVLSLFACSASKPPEDPSADADPGAAETRDPSDEDDGADPGAGDSPDEGGSDAGDTDSGEADPGDPGDTGASDTGEAPGGEDTAEEVDPGPDGAALYASHCAACHGPDGQGTGAAPDITGDIEGESDAGLIDLIQNGKDGMPGQDVTDEEAQAIVDWMRAGF